MASNAVAGSPGAGKARISPAVHGAVPEVTGSTLNEEPVPVAPAVRPRRVQPALGENGRPRASSTFFTLQSTFSRLVFTLGSFRSSCRVFASERVMSSRSAWSSSTPAGVDASARDGVADAPAESATSAKWASGMRTSAIAMLRADEREASERCESGSGRGPGVGPPAPSGTRTGAAALARCCDVQEGSGIDRRRRRRHGVGLGRAEGAAARLTRANVATAAEDARHERTKSAVPPIFEAGYSCHS